MIDCEGLLWAHQFALVDRANLVPQDWHKGLPLLPLENQSLKMPPDKLPALLPLAPKAPYMKKLLENLEEAQTDPKVLTPCALFGSDLKIEPKQIQKRLGNRLVVRVGGPPKASLRYFDPTVFPKLARIFHPSRWHLLYGPIQTWTIPFQKEWISFPAPNPEQKDLAWIMTTEQWERTELIRYTNRTLTEYERLLGRPWENFEEYDKASITTERAMQTAQTRYGIKEKGGLQTFAIHALYYGENFHRHPYIQDFLKALPSEGYVAASNTFNQTIWEEAKTLSRNH